MANNKTDDIAVNKGKGATPQAPKRRAISDPREVLGLVMMQIDAVNSRKDELTAATKALSDTARQLARAYGQQAEVIQKLQRRVRELEPKDGKK